MRSENEIIVAAAGSGKTTNLVNRACRNVAGNARVALVTYTINNVEEIRKKIASLDLVREVQVDAYTWFSFILDHFVRPYQKALYKPIISGISFVNSKSVPLVAEKYTGAHYFAEEGVIYSDKLSKFAVRLVDYKCVPTIDRLEDIYSMVCVDEIQDLAGYDLDILELLLGSRISFVGVGDHRQATFKTNPSNRHKGYEREKIIRKFEEWERDGLVTLKRNSASFRCVQEICDLADALYPEHQNTDSKNSNRTGHDGVFSVERRFVGQYYEEFRPQVLRFSKSTSVDVGSPLNFGSSKGMTFERTLIYPHKIFKDFLKGTKAGPSVGSRAWIYVGLTRARQSVGIVVDDGEVLPGVERFFPSR